MRKKINELIEYLFLSHGIDLSGFDNAFIEKTVERRLDGHHGFTINDYVSFLKANEEEVIHLVDSMHISYSEFFRNPLTFSCLEMLVLPLLWTKKKYEKSSELRIWSAACASGQEAYSIAMLLDELKQKSDHKFSYRIFATDNNPAELAKAEKGIFGAATINNVIMRRLDAYFERSNDSFSVVASLKKQIDFSYFDLLTDHRACPTPSIFGNFDLVFCSNLLFYYKPAAQVQMLDKIANTMAPGAYLVTGETERDLLKKNNYQEAFAYSGIFQKNFIN